MARDSGLYLAVIVRVVLGVALIFAASESAFPVVFRVLGWIAIAAAAGLVFIGRAGMQRIVSWFDRMTPGFVRFWLVFGLAFSALLIYGVLGSP